MPPSNDPNGNHRRGHREGGDEAARGESGDKGGERGEGIEVMDLDGRSEIFVNRALGRRLWCGDVRRPSDGEVQQL